MKESNIEKQLENINKDVILEIYERMFEQVKSEINYLHNELTEVQKEIDIKDWNIDNSFQYKYVTRL
ncbi:hypothetical protein [Spiroplasma ixodetis]|uniref:hypothetical protein n=1 Tax=Spiroplasma ixodetis TaxID=2141 RepID=UPI002575596D|nr:hypothetical protein [Spiroplasma ixodetis]WJG70802.1 hypothetical protein SIXOD_v1c20480 [Spiroplasma ixodetis Y32]